MALFDPRRNRGHSRLGYSTSTTSSSHESTQRVVQYGGYPAWPGPIQGAVDNPLIWARGPSHYAWPKKDDDFYLTNGPPISDYHYGTYTNFSSDESDDDERDFIGKNRFNGPKPKNMKEDYEREKPRDYSYHEKPKSDGYKPPSYTVRVSTPPKTDPYHETPYNEKLKDYTYDNRPPSYIVNGSTHPKKDPYCETSNNEKPIGNTHSHNPPFNGSTHPKNDPYRETSNNEKPIGNTHSNNPPFNGSTHPKKDPYRETSNNQKPIGNTHSNSPPFNGPIHLKRDPYHGTSNNEKPTIESYHEKLNNGNPKGKEWTHPKKDPYYETSHTSNEKPKSNPYGPPSYMAPRTTQPKKDPDHETSTNRPMVYPLAPIKTSTNKGSGNLGESTTDSPVAVGTQWLSPRKEHEMIDSAEAQRLYGRTAPPRVEAPAGHYRGTMDSQEAARRFNGVFVNFPTK